MRFYQLEMRVNVPVAESTSIVEVVTEWFGTERDAVVYRNAKFQSGQLVGLKREQKIEPIDVPTDKAGLLKFLKNNVTRAVIV